METPLKSLHSQESTCNSTCDSNVSQYNGPGIASLDDNILHPHNSSDSSLSQVSLSSRLATLSRAVSESVTSILEQARDDNLQTIQERKHLRESEAESIAKHFQLDDALKSADRRNQINNSHNSLNTAAFSNRKPTLTIVDPDIYLTVSRAYEQDTVNKIDGLDTKDEIVKERGQQDKGYCWVIAVCTCLLFVSTWGSSAGYGVFLGFFLKENIFPGASAIDFAFVGSIILCLAQALAPLVMLLSSVLGHKLTMTIGLTLQSAGYILCSFATELWHIYVTLGVMVGVGFSLVVNPGLVIMPSWFNKYKATASGITVMGTGLGGVIFSLSTQSLIDTTHDYKWSARMVGVVVFVVNATVTILLKERIPTKKIRTWDGFNKRVQLLFDVHIWKNYAVWLVTFFYAFGQISYIIISYSMNTYATSIGLSQKQGSHLTSIFNAGQIVGRLMIGNLGDNFGRSNIGVIVSTIITIFTLCMWPFCKNFTSLLFFAIISGGLSAVANTLQISLLSNCVPVGMFPAAWSFENFWVGIFCLMSEPVSIKLRNLNSKYPFLKSQLFCGFLMLGGTFLVLPLREWRVRKVLQIRLENTKNRLIDMNSEPYVSLLAEFSAGTVHTHKKDRKVGRLHNGESNQVLKEKENSLLTKMVRANGLVQNEES
ncbi:hypothetical protein BVG19_g3021 [[Candida] boidinii]|nr:hypothetical protein BVG19_g3021 [[Candida] boidinii]OWB50021.1 hypothetical protein B5S27_g1567 [[Candida] boidinii]